jgi:hypothetical protein
MSRRSSLPRTLLALLALLLLTAGRCYERSRYNPTPGLVEETLSLTTAGNQTTLPADGISRLLLIAQISAGADLDKRTIVFSTSSGTLVGGTPGAAGMEVAADANGQAVIQLQSSQRVEVAVVKATVKEVPGITRQITIAFVGSDPNATLQFVAHPATAPADGASTSAFTVRLSSALPAGTAVAFQSTAGLFAPENAAMVTRTVDASSTATVLLVSPAAISTALVTATANNVTQQVTIDFVRALPDQITVSTNGKFQVKASASDSLAVVATFLRDRGTVTTGTVATFKAVDPAGRSLGLFRDVTTTDATGKATATFIAEGVAYRGPATIVVGAAGSGVTGTAPIEIVDP